MGLDLIYTYKKLIPRFMLVFVFFFVAMVVPLFVFNAPSWYLFWLFGVSAVFIGYLVLEFRRASRLAKGLVQNVPVLDLSRAIYWLSIICAGEGTFSLGGYQYWENVEKVSSLIGGNTLEEWRGMANGYALPRARTMYKLGALLFLCFPLIFALELLHFSFSVSISILAVVLLALMAVAAKFSSYLKVMKIMASDSSVKKATELLMNELINWASAKTNKPIKLVSARGISNEHTRFTGSLLGFSIIEITPVGTSSTSPGLLQQAPKGLSTFKKRIISIAIYVTPAALIAYFLVFNSIQKGIAKNSTLPLFVTFMGIFMIALIEYFLYSQGPLMFGLIKGDVSLTDFIKMIKRSGNGMMFRLSQDPMFKKRIEFFLEIYKQKSVKDEQIPEQMRLWINSETTQPPELGYLNFSQGQVQLTEKGKEFAELLVKKLEKTKNLQRLYQERLERLTPPHKTLSDS
jgi:hypothetical protein